MIVQLHASLALSRCAECGLMRSFFFFFLLSSFAPLRGNRHPLPPLRIHCREGLYSNLETTLVFSSFLSPALACSPSTLSDLIDDGGIQRFTCESSDDSREVSTHHVFPYVFPNSPLFAASISATGVKYWIDFRRLSLPFPVVGLCSWILAPYRPVVASRSIITVD